MNTQHPEDSLDNLSSLQVNRQRQLQAQVKQQFNSALQKLQSAQTREVGINELKRIIQQYREQEYLRGYIAILKTLKPNPNSATKEHQILAVSLLAQTYKKELLDPIDKPPSLLKTSFRMVEILHGYFSQHSPTVQQACARALLDLATHCLGDQPLQAKFSIIYSPLISVLKTGVDKASQATASACLAELINYSRRVGDQALLQRLSPDLLAVILRINSEYHELFQAILGMLEAQGLAFLDGRVVAFLSKLLSVVDGTREVSSVNTTNLNTYMCKVNVCKIIQKIAKLLPSAQRDKLFQLRIPEALQQAARHRIIQVQLAAGKALKAWRGEATEDSPPKTRGLTSLEDKRNNKKLQRSKSREDREKMESQLTFMKEDLQKLVKGGWGASNRAKNFVKKGSGVGGGFHGKTEVSPQSKSGGKSHKEHFQELRQFIKKSSHQNKNLDRFAAVGTSPQGRGRSPERSKSPPARSKSPPARSKSPSGRGKSPGKQQNRKQSGQEPNEIGFEEDQGDQMLYNPQKQGKSKPASLGAAGQKAGRQVKQGRNKSGKESDEIGFEEDEGDQMAYFPQKQEKAKPRSVEAGGQKRVSRFNDVGMSEEEARELVVHQKTLMEQGNRMNVNYYDISDDGRQKEGKKTQSRKESGDNKKKDQMNIPLNQHQYKMYTPEDPPEITKSKQETHAFQRLSQNELGQLMDEYSLSQVSENLDDVLSKSDLNALQASNKELIDSNILEPTQGKSEIDTLKQIVAQKKQRKSAVSKFLKRQSDEILPQSRTQLVAKQNLDIPSASLNFTQSQESRVKSPQKREEQFTLNPRERERFSTLGQQNREHEKQVQQQIAMSAYEQSFPRDQPLPRILPKVAPITQIPLRYSLLQPQFERPPESDKRLQKKQLQPEDRVDYQKLIKNPPKLQPVDPSRLKSSKASAKSYPEKSSVEQKQSEGQDIKGNWLQILNDVSQGQVNSAYESALSMDDPIYLLRLMLLSKLPMRRLSAETVQKVWRKFMEIYSQKFIDVLTVGLLAEGNELGLLSRCLAVQELHDALMGLYELSGSSKGKLSYKAATLYNDIEKKLHGE